MSEKAAVWEDINVLVPWSDNPRHNQSAIQSVADSIKRFGFASPIIAREADKMIIAGHTRLEAAKSLGLDRVPVRYLDLDPADAKMLALADNKIGEIADWDEAALEKIIDDLSLSADDMADLGWSTSELDDLFESDFDAVDEEPVHIDEDSEPVSKLGEVYNLGDHRLLCGDSTKLESWQELMGEEKADMVFTDPPYGMFLDTDYTAMQSEKSMGTCKKYDKVIGDHEDFDPKLVTIFFDIFSYCKEIFLWGADYYAEHLPDKNQGSWIVWDKRLSESMDRGYGSCFELCWSKKKHKRDLARIVWSGIFGMGQEEKRRVHPTQKPVKLVRWFFDRYGKERDIIVDGYGGSGSTLIAAAQAKRKARLIELDPKYCDVIRRRWFKYATEHNLDVGDGLDG